MKPEPPSRRRATEPSGSTKWPVAMLTLRKDLAENLRRYADDVDVAPADVLELLVTARVEVDDSTETPDSASVAADMLDRYEAGRYWTPADGPRPCTPLYDVALPDHVDVLVVRLGPARRDPPTSPPVTGGYTRTHIGASLTDTASDVWMAARGYWEVAQPPPQFLIATRLGRVMACYAVDRWAEASSGKRWAVAGWRLHGYQAHPLGADADLRRHRPYRGDEEAVAAAFPEGALIAYPPGPARSRHRIRPGSKEQRQATRRWRDKTRRVTPTTRRQPTDSDGKATP